VPRTVCAGKRRGPVRVRHPLRFRQRRRAQR
jgi:hypothetical protein